MKKRDREINIEVNKNNKKTKKELEFTYITDSKYNNILNELLIISNFYEFYTKILSKFSNNSIAEFIKDYKSTMINKFPMYNFNFIKITNKKETMIKTIDSIYNFSNKISNLQDYNIYNLFIKQKILSSIDEIKYHNILTIINKNILNIFNIFEIFKIIFRSDNLINYSNYILCATKKIKNKNNAINFIFNNSWSNYIKFLSSNNKLNFITNYNIKKIFMYYKSFKLQSNYNIKKIFLKRWKLIIDKNNHDNYLNKWDPTKNMKFLSQNQLDDKLSLMFTNIELKED